MTDLSIPLATRDIKPIFVFIRREILKRAEKPNLDKNPVLCIMAPLGKLHNQTIYHCCGNIF